MTQNKRFEEKKLDSKDYEKEKHAAGWLRGIGTAIVTIGGIVVAALGAVGKSKNNKA